MASSNDQSVHDQILRSPLAPPRPNSHGTTTTPHLAIAEHNHHISLSSSQVLQDRSKASHEICSHLPPLGHKPSLSSVYMGSFSPRRSLSRANSFSARATPQRPSTALSRLGSFVQDLNIDQETYGIEELRDGFFDASFFESSVSDQKEFAMDAEFTVPVAYQSSHPFPLKYFLKNNFQCLKRFVEETITTQAGIKLSKSFLGVYIAYLLCLVPSIKIWLGRYGYVMVVSAILNHPGRSVGSQIDGILLTSIGTATGLGWGAFNLWLWGMTPTASHGYDFILATSLILFMGTISIIRSCFIRLYQLVLCAGIAISYVSLADTSSDGVEWVNLLDYGIPWILGQAISLVICSTVFPDTGSRPFAVALHGAFETMQDGLKTPLINTRALHRNLAWSFVCLSQARRDFALDTSIGRFDPQNVLILRDLMQRVIRSLLALKSQPELFDKLERRESQDDEGLAERHGIVINIDNLTAAMPTEKMATKEKPINLAMKKLAKSTFDILSCMRTSLASCDAALMGISGFRKYLGPPKTVSSDVLGALAKLRETMAKYDEEEESLMKNLSLPSSYSDHPEVVKIFLFVFPVRRAATSIEALLVKIMEMQRLDPKWKLHLPSYPCTKSLRQTNATVRHDRGYLMAGFYFNSRSELEKMMKGIVNDYKPLPRQIKRQKSYVSNKETERAAPTMDYEEDGFTISGNQEASKRRKLRYRLWLGLHRLQDFETRYTLKVAIVTSLISLPAWFHESRYWWVENDSWWAVAVVWIMMHPRVGGNFQDIVSRTLCCVLGAVWAILACVAANGNEYVMAVFAAIYLIPMLYRFTQSSHPQSGIMGCLSFVVISLSYNPSNSTVMMIAWTRGIAFVVGEVAAAVVNWMLWPFTARHELRKAISAMMIHSSTMYSGVVAKYLYHEKGVRPENEDNERSEILEGRLREGFVRIRQLMELTRHEIRLRGPFDAMPYSALIDNCERFFEHVVAVRQSSLFPHTHYLLENDQAAESLLTYQRDAVAAVLINLYVLAGALRGGHKVPKYLPSAVAARKRLLYHMTMLKAEAEQEQEQQQEQGQAQAEDVDKAKEKARSTRRQIYNFTYSENLTGCVEQLEQLQKYTKQIVGERGFDFTEPGSGFDTHPRARSVRLAPGSVQANI